VFFMRDDDGSNRVWWWPPGASQPRPTGPALKGTDHLSVDPVQARVVVSTGVASGGVLLIDLVTGATHKVAGHGSSDATFSPDGRRILYIQDAKKLKFVKP
jgi:hypothetical protein